MPIYLLATLDTKGQEIAFIRDYLAGAGFKSTIVDCGCLGEPTIRADVSRDEVFAAAGVSVSELRAKNDRGSAVTKAAEGVAKLVRKHFDEGRVQGVLGIGGSAGTTIGTAAMRALPLGVPKLMVSTLASGNTHSFVGDKDVLMLNSIVNVAGLNRVSRVVFAEAAAAMAGMVRFANDSQTASDRPLIAATMFGVTTPCVTRAREILEAAGYEVLVFHATGNGGQAMESLIRDGLIAGVLDITTTELADEFVGGVFSAGPTRLTAAGEMGIPQVVSVGATDMVNFHARETVPERFRSRRLHQHNANVTLMRTTPEENMRIGEDIGQKLVVAKGPVVIFLPLHGVSAIDRMSQPFDDPSARTALFDAIRRTRGGVELVELDKHINDREFAEAAASRLIELLKAAPSR